MNHLQYPQVGIFKADKPAIDFDNSFATLSSLEEYYQCSDCKHVWKETNKEFSYECPNCGSEHITNIQEDEYVSLSGDEKSPEDMIPLTHIKRFTMYKENKS